MTDQQWSPYQNGATINTKGSEGGIIVADEEHSLGARITLEKDPEHAPFAITCGIYSQFLHTHFTNAESGQKDYDLMKKDLTAILNSSDAGLRDTKLTKEFVERYA